MADVDRELANRLSRLAAAVPVSASRLDPVHRGAVEARQRVRMAWLTPAVVLVIGAVVFGLLRVGPTSQGSAVTSTVRDGDFALTLRSAKDHYSTTDPIDVVGELTYSGTASSIVISADSDGPVLFSVREPVFGEIQLGGMSDLMCDRSTLTRNAPLIVPFRKSGAFDGEHPQASQFLAYMQDPVFRLPAGTWHIDASAQGSCMGQGPSFKLQTGIVIVVSDDPNATPGLPDATPWADKPVYGGDDIGDFTMQLRAGHSTYDAGAPIDLSAWYTFVSGAGNSVTVSHFAPEMAFSITEVGAEGSVVRRATYDSACQQLSLRDAVDRHVELTDGDLMEIDAANWPQATVDALKHGVLELPPGRWRITAVVDTTLAPCGAQGESRQLKASIEFDVVDPAGPHVTPSAPAAANDPTVTPTMPAVSDVVTSGQFTLKLSADRAVYHASDAITVTGTFAYGGSAVVAVQGFVPWDFSIAEPVYGMTISEYLFIDCSHAVLEPGERMEHTFVKSGGVGPTDPEASFKLGYLTDPVLHLPPGTWHIRASSSLTEGTCGDKTVSLSTEIVIQVLPDP